MSESKTALIGFGFSLLHSAGCILFGPPNSTITNRLPGVASIQGTGTGIKLESDRDAAGAYQMRVKRMPTASVNLKVGEAVNLPIFNGRADYRLDAMKGNTALFTADKFYCTCCGPLYVIATEHIALVNDAQLAG